MCGLSPAGPSSGTAISCSNLPVRPKRSRRSSSSAIPTLSTRRSSLGRLVVSAYRSSRTSMSHRGPESTTTRVQFRAYAEPMTSAAIAALIAVLALGFVEGMRRFYPARRTWLRIRSRHGRRAARLLALLLLALVVAWIAASSLLDKFWYEVALDALPYAFVSVALLRIPSSLRVIGKRMREYERSMGEDPDAGIDGEGDGPTAIAL